ncbi:MAG TPA: signal peptidase I [Capsulimonadaceae bacterium]|nr:signal peptidase I [Capsulimonadaceae bacterium]
MHVGDLTERLADIHVSSIVWFVAILTVVRLALVRSEAPALRAVVEIVEAALIAAVLVFMVIQPFIAKAFYIPSPSMVPTLIEDDHILVNKLEYRLEPPHHEDIVVFAAPPHALETGNEDPAPDGQPTDYIKRLIGLPGDTIEVSEGYVQVGDRVYGHGDLESRFGLGDQGHEHLKLEQNDILVYSNNQWITYDKEQLATRLVCSPNAIDIHPGYVKRNGVKLVEPYIAEDPDYDLKIVDGQCVKWQPAVDGTLVVNGEGVPDQVATQLLNSPPGKVPPGHVIVMGDNRNDSNDSTAWGPLEESRLVGKAFFIFYPFPRVRVLH